MKKFFGALVVAVLLFSSFTKAHSAASTMTLLNGNYLRIVVECSYRYYSAFPGVHNPEQTILFFNLPGTKDMIRDPNNWGPPETLQAVYYIKVSWWDLASNATHTASFSQSEIQMSAVYKPFPTLPSLGVWLYKDASGNYSCEVTP